MSHFQRTARVAAACITLVVGGVAVAQTSGTSPGTTSPGTTTPTDRSPSTRNADPAVTGSGAGTATGTTGTTGTPGTTGTTGTGRTGTGTSDGNMNNNMNADGTRRARADRN